jgi:hypothetical protein
MANNTDSPQKHKRVGPIAYGDPEHARESVLEEYLTVLLREKKLFALVAAVVFIAVAIYTFTLSPVYESTALVLVDTKGKQKMPIFDSPTGAGTSSSIMNELEVLKSRSLAEATARALLKIRFVDSVQSVRIKLTSRTLQTDGQSWRPFRWWQSGYAVLWILCRCGSLRSFALSRGARARTRRR